MEFFRRAAGVPTRLAVFPGTFNPVTVAHLALGRSGADHRGRSGLRPAPHFPPQRLLGRQLSSERVELLCLALDTRAGFSIAASEGGLFVEIAEECRRAYGDIQLSFLCGRDAAERIANWDYGDPDAFAGMLRQFDFLVAARSGEYLSAGARSEHRSPRWTLECNLDHVSASEIRARIAAAKPGNTWCRPACKNGCAKFTG